MKTGYTIRPARATDVPALPTIELAAARLFEGRIPETILAEATDLATLHAAQREGRLWVAATGDFPVGFAIVEILADGLPHLDEIDVDPSHGKRGLGAALVGAVCEWACAGGHPSISLTTFRDIAWNMPFYAHMGFEVVPDGDIGPALREVVDDETARGLDPTTRVVMRYRCRVR